MPQNKPEVIRVSRRRPSTRPLSERLDREDARALDEALLSGAAFRPLYHDDEPSHYREAQALLDGE